MWHGEADDGSRIELLTDTSLGNGDYLGRYFKLTTLDGTQYFFGRNKRFAGDTPTNSGQSVLVYGNNVGEPCHSAVHDWLSGCYMNLRWYLDYVVDPRGNSMTLLLLQVRQCLRQLERHRHPRLRPGRHAGPYRLRHPGRQRRHRLGSDAGDVWGRDALLRRAVFGASGELAGHSVGPVVQPPVDIVRPVTRTFWTPFLLASVTTQVWNGAGNAYQNVDQWTLSHSFPSTLDSSPSSLWFGWFQHTGFAGGTSVSEPSMHFGGDVFANLVVASGVRTSTNGWTGSATASAGSRRSSTTRPNATPATSSACPGIRSALRCYPQWNGSSWSWYHKYTVHTVIEQGHHRRQPRRGLELRLLHGRVRAPARCGISTTTSPRRTCNGRGPTSPGTARSPSATAPAVSPTPTPRPVLPGHGRRSHRLRRLHPARLDHRLGRQRPARPAAAARVYPGGAGPRRVHVVSKTFHTPNRMDTGTRTGSWYMSTVNASRIKEWATDTSTWIAATSSWRTTRVQHDFETTYGLEYRTHRPGDNSDRREATTGAPSRATPRRTPASG